MSKQRWIAAMRALGLPLVLAASVTATACDVEPAEINLRPTSLDEAAESLEAIDELAAVDGERARAALEQIQPVLDQLNHLVARLEVQPGYVVSFYEPRPGLIGVSETTPLASERILRSDDVRGRSMVQLYEQLSGDAAPTTLVEAQERADEARKLATACQAESALAEGGSPALELGAAALDDGIGSTSRNLTADDGPWWSANVCFDSGDFRGCHPNWANGGFAQANTKTSFFQVAPVSGNAVSVRFQYEGNTSFTDAVFPGEWRSWWWHSDAYYDCWCSPVCACGTQDYNERHHRWDILNASGDGFHWTYAFKWTCDGVLACDEWP